jgi:hypothetical protein
MPTPKKNETQDDFVARCIPYLMKEKPGMKSDQAAAICYSIWDRKNEDKIENRIDKLLGE